MNALKIPEHLRKTVTVRPTMEGYAVQVYGQTILRSSSQFEARKFARDLRRVLA